MVDESELIERILATRKPRELQPYDVEFLREHSLQCVECLRAQLHPSRFKPCVPVRLYTTDPDVYDYCGEEKDWKRWYKTKQAWREASTAQRARNPILHRRFASGVKWLFPPQDARDYRNNHGWTHNGSYIRVEWAVSSFQVIIGHLGGYRKDSEPPTEELLYHSYADCE